MRERGQILPLFAICVTAIIAMMALAIDVSFALSTRRAYRSIADAAALAGAQDLQGTTRAVTAADRMRARGHAYDVIANHFGITTVPTGAGCDTFGADLTDCVLPGTPYRISIKTPISSRDCVTCVGSHAVQVTVRNPEFQLSFARVVGINTWNVGVSAVAGLSFESRYALMTLRPPDILPNSLDQNRDDIDVNGNNTRLNILEGDVGTNTSAVTNSGGFISLANGYFIDHYDDIFPDPWNKDLMGNPQGRLIRDFIEDPNYVYPSTAGASRFRRQSEGRTPCTGILPTEIASLTDMTCYRPGVYERNFNVGTGGETLRAYLSPGVYFLTGGASIHGELYGGLTSGTPGISIYVPRSRTFDARNTEVLRLNTGPLGCATPACGPTAAADPSGTLMQTPEGLLLTFTVERDSSCFVGTVPRLCSDNGNRALNLAGNSEFRVGGVIYGPSDRMQINSASTAQTGSVGQIISWTVVYSGGAQLNQSYPSGLEVGSIRLDAACTAPGTPCNP